MMNIEIFKVKNDAVIINVSNNTGLDVILCSVGASIYSIKLDLEPMILSYKKFEDFYVSPSYQGKTIGRISGRVKDGILNIGDKTIQLDKNENGINSLHGGKDSLAFKNFKHQITRYSNGIIVRFHLTTKNGESGYNGKCDYVITYRIPKEDNHIIVEYEAKCKEDTYFSLLTHPYYNLCNQKDIMSHKLTIASDEVSVMEGLIVKNYMNVENTIFDFREGKIIGKDIKDKSLHSEYLNGYDHKWKLNNNDLSAPQVELEYGNYKVDISSDFDAVVVFTDGFAKEMELENGEKETNYKGVAIEPCSLYPEFVKKKNKYYHKVKIAFERKFNI